MGCFCIAASPPRWRASTETDQALLMTDVRQRMPGRLKVSISTEQGRGGDLKFVGRQREFAIGRQSVDERPHAAHTVGKARQAAIVLRLVNSG